MDESPADSLDDATAVVTGASRGIGRAVTLALAERGAHVVCCSREREGIASTAETARAAGGSVTALRADVRDEFDLERLMETAGREGGGIDYLVANAGVYHGQPGETPLSRESYAAFDDHFRTNARGVFAAIREALPHLSTGARVVVPSGRVAREGVDGYGSYAVSKAAAEALARGFAADIDYPVGVVDPGQVATDLSGDRGRDPADAAEMILWALDELAADELDGAVLDVRDWRSATR
ncbi:MAG: SDR family NAD(P)-dependent oxidoreductase [Haloarculaceae archaeon]